MICVFWKHTFIDFKSLKAYGSAIARKINEDLESLAKKAPKLTAIVRGLGVGVVPFASWLFEFLLTVVSNVQAERSSLNQKGFCLILFALFFFFKCNRSFELGKFNTIYLVVLTAGAVV